MLKPTSDTGIYLHHHKHEWEEVGANLWPSGVWCPVFYCTVCTDVICDVSVELGRKK